MNNSFLPADILLPKSADLKNWAVIACDQHTSDMVYWQRVRQTVADALSTLHMILPEAELAQATQQTIDRINAYMRTCLETGVLTEYSQSFVYVERTLKNGTIRQGIVGMVDLEGYDNSEKTQAPIRATEKTVLERIPPRVAVRKDARLEFSHVALFCDDARCSLIEPVCAMRDSLPLLYSFDLMENGGHIAGWLLCGEQALAFERALRTYEESNVYLVGDGNHSLVTAKRCYEDLKRTAPEEIWSASPARYALVELENIHSPTICFEPIHRVLTNTDPDKLISDLEAVCADDGYPVKWVTENDCGEIRLAVQDGELPVGVLQRFLDSWLQENSGQIDYIHDEDALLKFSRAEGAIGLFAPKFEKCDLFPYILAGNTLPRKAFSLGHGDEKRYYLEGRRIK